MSKAKKISLSAMLERLQEIEHYKNPNTAFNALLYGWCVATRHSAAWLYNIKKRNEMSMLMAGHFASYCLGEDWQKMMPK